MAFCSKCGLAVPEGATFCSGCGSPVSSPASSPGASAGSAMSSNIAAALSYLLWLITGIIFLVIEPYKTDKFVRFHAFQSIFFSVAVMVFWIVWSRVVYLGFYSLGFLWTIFGLLSTLIYLAIIVFWLFLMYKAYNKERYMIPVIGEWAAKQAGS